MASNLSQAVVHLDLRPIRLGYLVRQGSREDFRTAVLEASSRWGGIQEIIIPVRRSGAVDGLWKQILELFPVDYFCAVFPVPTATTDILQKAFGVPIMGLDQFQFRSFGLHAIGACPPARIAALEVFSAAPGGDVVNLAALGGLANDEQAAAWASRGAVIRESVESGDTASAQLAGTTLIATTGHQCGETLLRGFPGSPILIWVARPNGLSDAVHYWNTRALIPLRLSTTKSCIVTAAMAADPSVKKAVASAVLSSPYPLALDVLLFSQTVSVEQREELTRQLGLELFAGSKPERDTLGPARPDRPIFAKATWDPLRFIFGEREPGQRVSVLTVVLPEQTIIRASSPVEFNGGISGELRARFSGPTQFKLPPGRSLGRLFNDVAVVHQGAVEIQTGTNDTYEFRLRVPTPSDLLVGSLMDRGVTTELSDKGRMAAGAIQLARDTTLFRSDRVRQIIESLTTHRYGYELKEARAQLGGNDDDLEGLVARLREVRQVSRTVEQIAGRISSRFGAFTPLDVAPVLNQLVDGGLAARGLQIDCGVCRFPSFVELDRVRAPMSCPACGAAAGFVSGSTGEPSLHYRLNALLDRASDNGVLGHLVGMAALLQDNPSAFVMPGVNLQLPSIGQREADLLALVEGEIGVGEAKTSAGLFTEDQFEKDLTIATALGAAAYLMVCLEPLDRSFKTMVARRCVGAGLRPLCVEGAAGPLARLG